VNLYFQVLWHDSFFLTLLSYLVLPHGNKKIKSKNKKTWRWQGSLFSYLFPFPFSFPTTIYEI